MSGFVIDTLEGVSCDADNPGDQALIVFEFHEEQVALRGQSGRYLSTAAGDVIWSKEDSLGLNQRFHVLKAQEQAGSRIAFKSGEGTFLSVESNGRLSAKEESLIREEQLFEICITTQSLRKIL